MGITSFRCNDAVKKELDFIKSVLQMESQTEAIREAIHMCYEVLHKKYNANSAEIFKKSGFIGAFKGDRHLSTNYKKKLKKG